MRGKLTLLAGVCAGAIAFPAYAQTTAAAADDTATDGTEIIVTAQRTNQKLQDVPIAISADDPASASRTCADKSGPAASSARSIKIGVSRAWPGSDHASSLRCSQPANRESAWL